MLLQLFHGGSQLHAISVKQRNARTEKQKKGFVGAGQATAPIFANYGDGYATDTSLTAGLSSPVAFFTALLNKAYLNQVVIAPHVSPLLFTTLPFPPHPPPAAPTPCDFASILADHAEAACYIATAVRHWASAILVTQ